MTMRMPTVLFFYAIYFLRYYFTVTCYLKKNCELSLLSGEKEAVEKAELGVEFAGSLGGCLPLSPMDAVTSTETLFGPGWSPSRSHFLLRLPNPLQVRQLYARPLCFDSGVWEVFGSHLDPRLLPHIASQPTSPKEDNSRGGATKGMKD